MAAVKQLMPQGKEAFGKLHALGEERRGQVDEMLARGLPASQVVAVVQKQWKVWAADKPESLKKMLERYRKTELRERTLRSALGAVEGVRISSLTKKLNAMEELTELVTHQKDRFEKMYLREKPGPLLMKQVSDEGRLLKEMLVELGKLQLETGVLARAPKKVVGSLTDANGSVQAFEWTVEQESLFKQLEAGEYVALE